MPIGWACRPARRSIWSPSSALLAGAAAQPGRRAIRRSRPTRLRRALERYRGDLLPEDGPAEWLVEARDRARLAAVGAARSLAELRLRAGDLAGAIQACLRGLAIDRYDDASVAAAGRGP